MKSKYCQLLFELWEITWKIEKIDLKKYWLAKFKIIVNERNKILKSLRKIKK